MESVRGLNLTRPDDGTTMYIGLSKQAEGVIGMYYDEYTDMKRQLSACLNLREANNMHIGLIEEELTKVQKAGVLTRLKWLILGYKGVL